MRQYLENLKKINFLFLVLIEAAFNFISTLPIVAFSASALLVLLADHVTNAESLIAALKANAMSITFVAVVMSVWRSSAVSFRSSSKEMTTLGLAKPSPDMEKSVRAESYSGTGNQESN